MSERTPRVRVLHSVTIPTALSPEALAAFEAAVARIATLEAQRDALVPLAQYGCDSLLQPLSPMWVGRPYVTDAARAALAAIAAERETTTEGGQDDA